jgi:hypothetical protein
MKINLNLAIPEKAREHYALAWAIPAMVLGLGGLLFLASSTVRAFRDYRSTQRQIAACEQREEQLGGRETALRRELEEPQSRQVLQQVQYLNGLIEKKQISLAELAAKVTELLPAQARLTGLALQGEKDDLMVRFTVTGRSEEALETFLSHLEDSPAFQDVAIVNQGFQEEGAGPEPVTISCTARYLPGSE